MAIIYWFLYSILSLLFVVFIFFLICRLYLLRKKQLNSSSTLKIGFFHPYCNAGGGGERVLWCAIRTIIDQYKEQPYEIFIYTGDIENTSHSILQKVKERFGIVIDSNISLRFIPLQYRYLVEDKQYPRFTLLGQSIGSMFLAFEAIFKEIPDLFIDTTGYAFTFPIVKIFGGCCIVAYVHYPTISTDMLKKVASRISTYNNSQDVSLSSWKSSMKLIYYHIFAFLYGLVGQFASVTMVNSTWTKNHINQLWKSPNKTFVVYPPCDTNCLQKFPLEGREKLILSIAQFRPEKNHLLQLQAFASLRKLLNPRVFSQYKLILIGSCRGKEDEERVFQLHQHIEEFNLKSNVEILVNASYDTLKSYFSKSSIGIHTMWNEHFGIGVVEMMAAGLITIAHNSGGPREDILKPYQNHTTGFLATSREEYATCLKDAIECPTEMKEICKYGRLSSLRFSDEVFDHQFWKIFSIVLKRYNKN